jgi:hypothetical protein
MKFEVVMVMNIMITIFQDAIPCSLALRKPAASILRVTAVWKRMVHDKEMAEGTTTTTTARQSTENGGP